MLVSFGGSITAAVTGVECPELKLKLDSESEIYGMMEI